MARQNSTKLHYLFSTIKEQEDYFPFEDKEEVLMLIKDIYNEYVDLETSLEYTGTYGIRFRTVEEDSRYSDENEIFFKTKQKRDDVFDDWINGRYWDEYFEQPLVYPTPTPNGHRFQKIFKKDYLTYEEKSL